MVNYLLNLVRRGCSPAPAEIRPVINPSFPPILKAALDPPQGIGKAEVSGKYRADNASQDPGQTTAPKLLALPEKRPDSIPYPVFDSGARSAPPTLKYASDPDPEKVEKTQENKAPGYLKMQQRLSAEQSASETSQRIEAKPDDKLRDGFGQKELGQSHKPTEIRTAGMPGGVAAKSNSWQPAESYRVPQRPLSPSILTSSSGDDHRSNLSYAATEVEIVAPAKKSEILGLYSKRTEGLSGAIKIMHLTSPEAAAEYPLIKPSISSPHRLPRIAEPAIPESNKPEVQVHIGTVEVRATVPPSHPPATSASRLKPKPQGFDEYRHMRSYVSWEM